MTKFATFDQDLPLLLAISNAFIPIKFSILRDYKSTITTNAEYLSIIKGNRTYLNPEFIEFINARINKDVGFKQWRISQLEQDIVKLKTTLL